MDLVIITYSREKRKPTVCRVITDQELRDNNYSLTKEGVFKYLTLFVEHEANILNVVYSPDYDNLPEYPIF